MQATSKDGEVVAIKFQSPRATDAEVDVLRHMTDAVCRTVRVRATFKVNGTTSAFVMPYVPGGWEYGLWPRVIPSELDSSSRYVKSAHRRWPCSPPHLQAVITHAGRTGVAPPRLRAPRHQAG